MRLVRLPWNRRRRRRSAGELSDEERASLAAEREHRARAQRQGEAYVRTYADPAANWGRSRDDRREDI